MAKILPMRLMKRSSLQYYKTRLIVTRSILSDAYQCEEAWQKRLENPSIKNLKMDQYFLETDKLFGTKRLASGVDIDLFANNVQNESELEELEHLLYRFRQTKRSPEIMDSTTYAVIRAFLKFEQYESLFRILDNKEAYGIFPDMYSYNILMSTFLKEKKFKEAVSIAMMMMLQENFDNKISCVLGLYSCQKFLSECSMSELNTTEEAPDEAQEENENEDEEQTLVRVPFLRNPFFDDHFQIEDPQHRIGKTLYLLGREIDSAVGRSYQILGFAMYEKWDKAAASLTNFSEMDNSDVLHEVVEKVQSLITAVPENEEKSKEKWASKFNELFLKMKSEGKIQDGDLTTALETELKHVLQFQNNDIEAQKKLFTEWDSQRLIAIKKQNIEIDKERRLKVIEEKKEYLFWKEKLLFFFENEEKNLKEFNHVEEMLKSLKEKQTVEESYVVPEMIRKAPERPSTYTKLARVKKL